MKPRLRITIEGQGGAAGNQLANVIAGMVQLAGYPTVHITDTATGYSSERGGLEVDAQIIVTPIKRETPEDALQDAVESGHGVFSANKRLQKAEAEAARCALMNDDQAKRVYEAEEQVKRLVELLKYYADEYRIAEDSGELQHWPDSEVKRCKAIAELLKEAGE